uniref:(northern house mosquito) hypothetical protein n=1 Tax=Culex pipiens TaxID=7175 RepID=A0A8D8GGL9_CULPI
MLSSSLRTFFSCRNSCCFSLRSSCSVFSIIEICSLVSPSVITSCFSRASRSFRWRSSSTSASISCFLRSRSRMMWRLRAFQSCSSFSVLAAGWAGGCDGTVFRYFLALILGHFCGVAKV